MNDPAPKPCPCCGSDAVTVDYNINDEHAGYCPAVQCTECGLLLLDEAQTVLHPHGEEGNHDYSAVIEDWNRRPNPETQAVAWMQEAAESAADIFCNYTREADQTPQRFKRLVLAALSERMPFHTLR